MPCLLCDGSIPFPRRLAGSQFCSEEHKRRHVSEQRLAALARLAKWREPDRNAPAPAGFIGLPPEPEGHGADEQGALGAETPIPRFYEVMVTPGRRRRPRANPMGYRVAPGAAAMPSPAPPTPAAASPEPPLPGRLALVESWACPPAGTPGLLQALAAPIDQIPVAHTAVSATSDSSPRRFSACLALPVMTPPLTPGRIRMVLSAPRFDLPEMRLPTATIAATLSIALPVAPVLLETAPSPVSPDLDLDLEMSEASPFDGLTPAEFLIEAPRALPTALSGSSAPVQAVVGFPLYPVWLPALFALSNRIASLRGDCWFPAFASAIPSPVPGWLGAEGPGFSGSLSLPASRAPYRDFEITPAVVESPVEATGLTMTYVRNRPATLADLWRSAPALLRGAALSLALVAPAVYLGSKIQMQLPSADWSQVRAAARARATIDLQDDFRAGFNAWSGPKGWAGSWSADRSGSVRPGRLALFQPSVGLSDYRFEFTGQIDSRALSFVFRAPDTNNYQAVKLTTVKPGPLPTLALVHYAVINGREGPKSQTPVPFEARQDTLYRLAVTVQGDHFSVDVNGQFAGAWTDDRLKSGGVGFFGDKGESARVRAVHVVDKQDFLGWLCSQVSPWTADRQESGVTHE